MTGCVARHAAATLDTDSSATGTVTKVYDGDTLEIETTEGVITVRLAGINAPETDECFGDRAADHLEQVVGGGTVALERIGSDQFDRTLAYVLAGSTNVNLDLVERGLAIATSSGDEGLRPSLLMAEEDAYAGSIGLWAPDACGVSDGPGLIIDGGGSEPNPPGPDGEVLDDERVVIVNDGDTTISMAGWTLRDESSLHRLVFGADTQLDAGSRLVISSDDPRWKPGQRPVWNNDGDMALLQDGMGNVIDRWRY